MCIRDRDYDPDRHAQLAASGAALGSHRVLLRRPPGGRRRDEATVHEPARGADRGIHHGEVRMSATDGAVGSRHFHEELDTLKQRLLDMSGKAEALLDLAIDALLKRDGGLAEAVLPADHEIDLLEVEVEELAVSLLALQQPMARDLRFIVGAIKISSDLERVGDHAVNIAEATQRLIRAGNGPQMG